MKYCVKASHYLYHHVTGRLGFINTFLINGLLVSAFVYLFDEMTYSSPFYRMSYTIIYRGIVNSIFIILILGLLVGMYAYLFTNHSKLLKRSGESILSSLFIVSLTYMNITNLPGYYNMSNVSVRYLVKLRQESKGIITYYEESKFLEYEGDIYIDLMIDLKDIIESKKVDYFLINSNGGMGGEAFRIYDYLKDRKITLMTQYCYSACTIIYAAGYERIAFPKTKFGFHMGEGFILPERQEDVQENRFLETLKTIVSDDQFINTVFHTMNNDMYEPEVKHMYELGYVTKMVVR